MRGLRKDSEYIKIFLIGICLFLIAYFSPLTGSLKTLYELDDISSWYTYHFSKKKVSSLKLISIVIDDYALNKISQRWPWKRSIYAELIKILDKEKVNTIGFDLNFVGESKDKEEDSFLQSALSEASSKVVLAYHFDYKEKAHILPFKEFRETAYSLGMVNTPIDRDGRIRRLRGFITLNDQRFYSFVTALSAAFLGENPQKIVSRIPFLPDKTFFINYLITTGDIISVSFYDVLKNLASLKEKYGDDFFENSLVVVYPEAEIIHDIYQTPLGRMPGGILNLNGTADILLKCFIKRMDLVSLLLFLLSFWGIFYILLYRGFLSGVFFTLGIMLFNFWFLVLLNLNGLKFDYSRIVFFGLLFFVLGSLYKYISFLAQLLVIKNKATQDPLRGVYTLRYFYYRLELELKKIYFRRNLFLLFIVLESLETITENMNLDGVKDLWQQIRSASNFKDSFWTIYSGEELVGCVTVGHLDADLLVNSLKNNLGYIFQERGLNVKIKTGCVRLKKGYNINQLFFVVASELKNSQKDIIVFEDETMVSLLHSLSPEVKHDKAFLTSLNQDIEEKNKQLLVLIKDLKLEHAKTKEAFMEIIASLAKALEARDPYTQGHSERVVSYALLVAQELGWVQELKDKLKCASVLHDLGKIGIPDSILHKKDKLTDEEYDFIKKHELISIKIIEPLKEFKDIMPWIMYHHERWDGKGYPHGLGGNNIPLGAQIIALADTFDTITTGRDYKKAFSFEEAIQELNRVKGTQFNPELIDVFAGIIKRKMIDGHLLGNLNQ